MTGKVGGAERTAHVEKIAHNIILLLTYKFHLYNKLDFVRGYARVYVGYRDK